MAIIVKPDSPFFFKEAGVPALYVYEIVELEKKYGVKLPFTVSMKFKVGKKKKLKRVKLVSLHTNSCETCGSHTFLTIERNGKQYSKEI